MKLRLQIATSPERSFVMEHATPILRIGRDPRCEVAIAGDSNQAVSWDHARIELTNRVRCCTTCNRRTAPTSTASASSSRSASGPAT